MAEHKYYSTAEVLAVPNLTRYRTWLPVVMRALDASRLRFVVHHKQRANGDMWEVFFGFAPDADTDLERVRMHRSPKFVEEDMIRTLGPNHPVTVEMRNARKRSAASSSSAGNTMLVEDIALLLKSKRYRTKPQDSDDEDVDAYDDSSLSKIRKYADLLHDAVQTVEDEAEDRMQELRDALEKLEDVKAKYNSTSEEHEKASRTIKTLSEENGRLKTSLRRREVQVDKTRSFSGALLRLLAESDGSFRASVVSKIIVAAVEARVVVVGESEAALYAEIQTGADERWTAEAEKAARHFLGHLSRCLDMESMMAELLRGSAPVRL